MSLKKILLLAVFLALAGRAYCGTVDSPYEVGTWSGFKAAAITYTFDDDLPKQLSIAIPLFNTYGFKATLYTVTNPSWYMPANWPGLQAAASLGHEIGSHTVSHLDLSLSGTDATYELSQSQTTINSNIPGNQCLTVAYPMCVEGNETLISNYYIAGRTCSSPNPNPATPDDFYLINCTILGVSTGLVTTDDITAIDVNAATNGGWAVFLVHALDNENGYSQLSSTVFIESVEYLDSHRSTFWVNNFLNVVKYIKERNDATVSETSNTGSSITLSVTDTLSDTIYNYPLTIRRPMPDGWVYASVSRDGNLVDSNIVEVNSTSYIMFDVVPDSGELTISKTIAIPTGLTASALNGMISLDWNDVNDGDLTGYNVYRSTTSGSGYSRLNSSLLTESDYNDSNVTLNTTYYYVVTAVDTNLTETFYSSEASVLTQDILSVKKCTVTASKIAGIGTIAFSGDMNASTGAINGASYILVTIDSGNMVSPYEANFPVNGTSYKKGKYSYSTTVNSSKESFQLNTQTHKFSFTAKNIDLTGLDCPVLIRIDTGTYVCNAEVNEAIINGKKPIPINLLMGVADSLRVDKIAVKQNTTKSGSDTLTVNGGFSALDADANMVITDVNVVLGTQTWMMPQGSFKAKKLKFSCSKIATDNQSGIAAASFDFGTGAFTLSIKNADINDVHGLTNFGVNFADVNTTTDVNLP